MPNTLTNLIPVIYDAKDIVLREVTGLIPAVTLDASAEQVAKNQVLRYPIHPSFTGPSDITPAATGPDPSARTLDSDTMTIDNVKSETFFIEAEEEKGLGSLFEVTMRDAFAQAMRSIINTVETDLASLYAVASRAYGTAGTTPFDSTNKLSFLAQLYKMFADNGAPSTDLQLVLNTTAGAALKSLTELWKANEAGTDDLLRRGRLLQLMGFDIRESAKIKNHTKGTGTGYLVNNASNIAIGDTTIAVDTGSNTLIAGDVVTFAADANNKYVASAALAAGSFSIAKPGARVAIPDNNAITIGNNYAANMAFSRSAIHLLVRQPAMPTGGDSADDVQEIIDPQTGITFQVAMYRQRRRVAYEVGLAWGKKVIKPEALHLLLG